MKTVVLFSLTLGLCMAGVVMLAQVPPQQEFNNPRIGRFWIAMDPSEDTVPGMNGGMSVDPQAGEDGRWRFYIAPNPNPQQPPVPWYNIWFYNEPFDDSRVKKIRMGFWIQPLIPGIPATVYYVVNWSTPDWAGPGYPKFNDEEFIMRSETNGPIPVPPPPPGSPPIQWIEMEYTIQQYNPEWVSVDIFGTNILISMESIPPPVNSPLFYWSNENPGPGGIIVHECMAITEFGDAPEGDTAYINPVVIGNFPTCKDVGPPGSYIVHNGCPNWLFFGAFMDCETDGNAGLCPTFGPNWYNMDECGTFPYPIPPFPPPPNMAVPDEGLIMPTPYTLGLLKPDFYGYFPCGANIEQPLGDVCQMAVWGQNIDIWLNGVNPQLAGVGFFNLMIDWNQDGDWLDVVNCGQNQVPEHVILNYPIQIPGYCGPLSAYPGVPPVPNFRIGPKKGFVWARFTLTANPVQTPWAGNGEFNDGETEDYLIKITGPSAIPLSNWPICLAAALIVLFTLFMWWRRK